MEIFSWYSWERFPFRTQLEKSSKAINKGTTPYYTRKCKENVLAALAVFHEITAAAIQSYFSDEKAFLSSWYCLVNGGSYHSKAALNTNNYCGNTAVNGDQKPSFLQAMAE